MKLKLKKWLRPVLFAAGGMALGLGYYLLIGCNSGTCAITSNPVRSMLYTGLIGLLLSGIFGKKSEDTCNT